MALQTKTYTVGTGVWDSSYVGFVLTLNITENSTSQANNTSNISYELILSNPNNQYPYEVSSATRYVELVLGPHTLSQNVTGSWVFNSSTTQKVLLSGSIDIAHNSDGSLAIDIYAKMPRLRTDGKGPQEMVISDTMPLTTISRYYTVTVEKGTGISSVSGSGTYVYGDPVTVSATPSTGYHFTNWTYNGRTYTPNPWTITSSITSDITVTANADRNTYTVIYDLNGGTNHITSQTFIYGSEDSISSSVPTREGYTFSYWLSNWNNVKFYPGDTIPASYGDFTLTAQWIRDENIIFNGNVVDKIVFNDQPVTSLVFNGNVIF